MVSVESQRNRHQAQIFMYAKHHLCACYMLGQMHGQNLAHSLWRSNLFWQMSYEQGWQKLLQGLVCYKLTAYLSVFNLFLTQWIMAILSKGCKLDNFEPHNSLKLNFTNILGLHSNFVGCESFLESNSPEIFCFMWNKLVWLSWFCQFLCEGIFL